jgi:hypothetical protein
MISITAATIIIIAKSCTIKLDGEKDDVNPRLGKKYGKDKVSSVTRSI